MRFLRYSLAALCLAASVAVLALWYWNLLRRDMSDGAGVALTSMTVQVEVKGGIAAVWSETSMKSSSPWQVRSRRLRTDAYFEETVKQRGRFGVFGPAIYFPLWYPALIFALASVGILRLGRFTIRSALIATTIVAALLGVVVVL